MFPDNAMSLRPLFVALLIGVLVGLGLANSAPAQQRPVLPSTKHATLQAQSDVESVGLPSVDVASLKAEDDAQSDDITPYRYGTVVDTDYRPSRNGTWEQLPSGDWVWRFRIQSRDAMSLSIGFSRFELPNDASLFISNPDGDLVRGPYTQADATNGQHWTPLVRGEEILVELEVPAGRRDAVTLVLGSVIHGYRSLFPERNAPLSKAGACNLDIACDQSEPWRDQVRSVARYTFTTSDGSASACTGSLVNNTREDKTPYFLTAEHCVTGPGVANSMTFYWNYQNDVCRRRGTEENGEVTNDDPADQTSSGAIMRARYGNIHENGDIFGKPDLTLVEVDDDIPDSYELYFNGWTREDEAPSESVSIHHPQGHGKRISFDNDPSSITAFGESGGGTTHLRIGNWETGTTEGGSSGSPLYDSDQRVAGVLSGGIAGCDQPGDIDDNNRPDWYGRLADGFNKGDYTPPGASDPTTPADFLDPNNTGRSTLDGRNLASFPPGRIQNFEVTEATRNSVTLEWTASGEGGNSGTALVYDLRLRTGTPITSTADFLAARQVQNLPAPEPAGSKQSVTVDVNPDSSYYFAIKAYDETYQPSELTATTQAAAPISNLQITTSPFPNPTSGPLEIGFAVEREQTVRAILYDALGRRVRTLFRREVSTRFQTRTEEVNVSGLSSGMYLLRLRGESATRTEQVVVIR